MSFRRHAVMCLATGCHIGRIPVAPGTWGSLPGLAVAYFLSFLSWQQAVAATLLLLLGAIWVAQLAEQQLGLKDPGCIVIDEIMGQSIALLAIPLTAGTCAAGFILFRIFDIAKPFPARYLERRLNGGWAVVLDDVAAGVMAQILLRLGLLWIR